MGLQGDVEPNCGKLLELQVLYPRSKSILLLAKLACLYRCQPVEKSWLSKLFPEGLLAATQEELARRLCGGSFSVETLNSLP